MRKSKTVYCLRVASTSLGSVAAMLGIEAIAFHHVLSILGNMLMTGAGSVFLFWLSKIKKEVPENRDRLSRYRSLIDQIDRNKLIQ